ncbi:toll-like receptor 2 type-2 [Glandiceps talaboti]
MNLSIKIFAVVILCWNLHIGQVLSYHCNPAVNVTCPNSCECKICSKYLSKGEQIIIGVHINCREQTAVPKHLPTGTFHLELSQNKITALGAGIFSHLKRVIYLSLKGNKLNSDQIHPNAFQGLDELEVLDLSDQTGLYEIPSTLFKPLRQLRTLRIQKANLVDIGEDAFRFTTYLYNVVLNENRLESIPPTLFNNLTYLRRVIIHYNSLHVLPRNMFLGSGNITDLQLAHCELSTISEQVGLQNLTKMENLHLYGNRFDCGCELRWFRNWIGSVKFIHKINDTKCSSGETILQFNPGTLQCEFPTVMVACVSVLGFILLCVVIFLLVNYRWRIRYGFFITKLKVWNNGYETIPDENNCEYKYDMFISHSSKDEEWVQFVLKPKLENPPYNYRLCLDFRDFVIGEHITTNIMNAIEESRKTVFILTKNFIDSEWCYFELEMIRQKMFDEHRDAAILVLKDDIPAKKMPGLLKYFMRKGNYIRWSDNNEGQKLFWKRLEAAVRVTSINMT